MYKATSNVARGFPIDPHAICGYSKLSISEHFLIYHLCYDTCGYSFKRLSERYFGKWNSVEILEQV